MTTTEALDHLKGVFKGLIDADRLNRDEYALKGVLDHEVLRLIAMATELDRKHGTVKIPLGQIMVDTTKSDRGDITASEALINSIRIIGLREPIIVRKLPGETDRYELVQGYLRVDAYNRLGLKEIEAFILEGGNV